MYDSVSNTESAFKMDISDNTITDMKFTTAILKMSDSTIRRVNMYNSPRYKVSTPEGRMLFDENEYNALVKLNPQGYAKMKKVTCYLEGVGACANLKEAIDIVEAFGLEVTDVIIEGA